MMLENNPSRSTTNLLKSPGQLPTAAAHALRGNILAAQGRFDEALEAFESALKLDSQDVRALQGMKSCKEIIRSRKPN